MTFAQALRLTNRKMIVFDLALGGGALLAPAATLRVLGHDEPSPDALRRTEVATDAIWAQSPAVSRPGAKLGLRLAGAANVAMAAGFAWMSRR